MWYYAEYVMQYQVFLYISWNLDCFSNSAPPNFSILLSGITPLSCLVQNPTSICLENIHGLLTSTNEILWRLGWLYSSTVEGKDICEITHVSIISQDFFLLSGGKFVFLQRGCKPSSKRIRFVLPDQKYFDSNQLKKKLAMKSWQKEKQSRIGISVLRLFSYWIIIFKLFD